MGGLVDMRRFWSLLFNQDENLGLDVIIAPAWDRIELHDIWEGSPDGTSLWNLELRHKAEWQKGCTGKDKFSFLRRDPNREFVNPKKGLVSSQKPFSLLKCNESCGFIQTVYSGICEGIWY